MRRTAPRFTPAGFALPRERCLDADRRWLGARRRHRSNQPERQLPGRTGIVGNKVLNMLRDASTSVLNPKQIVGFVPWRDVRLGSRLCENPIDAMIPLLNRGELMKGFVQGADRQQTTLLPECLDDWVDESNPVRAV